MKVYKTASPEPIISHVADAINSKLKHGRRVLWLLSGGSAIKIQVDIRRKIGQNASLTVGLVDERYGEVGHADSNWRQLVDAGFDLSGVQILPVLQGKNFEDTVQDYESRLTAAFENNDYRIGLFGMGPDGHTSGILPESDATLDTEHFVVGYQGPDFLRITTTFAFIKRLDEAVLCAYGAAKKPALEQLAHGNLPLSQQPAQILKQVQQFIIYNDQIGEEQ